MGRFWVVCFLLLGFLSGKTTLAKSISDPEQLMSLYQQDFIRRFSQLRLEASPATIQSLLELTRQQQRSDYEIYLLRRELISKYRSIGDLQSAHGLCQEHLIKADDYEIAAACVSSSPDSIQLKRQRLEALLRASIVQGRDTIVPAVVAVHLLDILWKQNDIAGARLVYETVVDITPKNAAWSLVGLKEAVALIYSNPSNSVEVIRDAARLYDELEAAYQNDPQGFFDAQRVAYNKGIVKVMSFNDYDGAMQEFRKITSEARSWMDSRVFMAFAAANLGRAQEARALLKTVQLDQYSDPLRRAFLECYRSMTLFVIKDSQDLSSCVQLSPDTQAEVLFHISKFLSQKSLQQDVEIKLWRQFWSLYQDKLAPQMQAQVQRYVSEMELVQARVESEVKDLELKNFNLVKSMLGLALLALISIFGLFIRLRSRNRKIEKLQTYIHKSVLSRFLPPILVEEIIQGQSRIESKPKEETVTVMFADMVGFTQIAGQLGAPATAYILNHFMEVVSEIIHEHGGTIDKFIGDAVMVIFGAPVHLREELQVERAVSCAEAMLQAIESLNPGFKKDYDVEVHIRIGIHHGSAIVGTFGSERRSDYTAIGPTVNLASRIEGAARPNEILLSAKAAAYLPAHVVESRGSFELKGIAAPVTLYAVKRASFHATRSA